ncbi:superoxide dismutase [Phenylobacterium montanum]|uniref:Superoxide dismutase n=1 Tax=Phenylobacterium montanum TaxID=2823693 RepID=A0A975FVR0_9CAUL|nr:superoxide dismutase [Caulobacter sp. S6]QUD86270.1 superoxide dismutase [Caulobacter sp. S6]
MFSLPDLPYAYDALQPVLSETTMRTHHDKHHARYVNVTNEILGDAAVGALEDVVRKAVAEGQKKLINNAGQAWNHALFWESMTPGGQAPGGDLAAAIDADFGGLEALKAKFVAEGNGHFGSGWVWLIAKGGKLSVETTHDGATALELGGTALLVCDLWEHAYYLDHKNDREGFLKAWFDRLANWRFADTQFAAAKADGAGWTYPAATAKAA